VKLVITGDDEIVFCDVSLLRMKKLLKIVFAFGIDLTFLVLGEMPYVAQMQVKLS
jgi:hypothetical protein